MVFEENLMSEIGTDANKDSRHDPVTYIMFGLMYLMNLMWMRDRV